MERRSRIQGGWSQPKHSKTSTTTTSAPTSVIPTTTFPTLTETTTTKINLNQTTTTQKKSTPGSNVGKGLPSSKSVSQKNSIPYRPDDSTTKQKNPQVIQDGMVYIPDAIDIPTQQRLYDWIFGIGLGGLGAAGHDSSGGGFYHFISPDSSSEDPNTNTNTNDSKNQNKKPILKLNMGSRGRMIESCETFPEWVTELCDKWIETGSIIDKQGLGEVERWHPTPTKPNTCLINFYKPGASFKWHKDAGEDPSIASIGLGRPIVSLSIGCSADFAFKSRYEDVEHSTLRLRSGDVLLFGGASRMIVHSITSVHSPNSCPFALTMKYGPGRLNLTFRQVVGQLDRAQFPKFRVLYPNQQQHDYDDDYHEND